jgi:tRNA pseudouridine13 synthase
MRRASGAIDADEVGALEASGVTLEDLATFDAQAPHLIEGARRPLRVPITDTDVEGGTDEHGPYVRCMFDLPRGSFATTVMREVMKPLEPGAVADEEA